MATFQVLLWDGIPAGVKATDDAGSVREELSPRFQAAIDNAAMATDRTDGSAYLKGWEWSEADERPGSAAVVAREVAVELEETHPPTELRRLSRDIIERGRESGTSD